MGCLVVVWLSLPQYSIVRLCSWPFQLHITHPVLLAVSEKPESQIATIFKVHSYAKLNLRPSVCSCVETLMGGLLMWWNALCVLLELLGLPMVSWWVISCDVATALGGLKALLTATFHLVPVAQEGAGEGFRMVGITTC